MRFSRSQSLIRTGLGLRRDLLERFVSDEKTDGQEGGGAVGNRGFAQRAEGGGGLDGPRYDGGGAAVHVRRSYQITGKREMCEYE